MFNIVMNEEKAMSVVLFLVRISAELCTLYQFSIWCSRKSKDVYVRVMGWDVRFLVGVNLDSRG